MIAAAALILTSVPASANLVYGLTASQGLVSFDALNPGAVNNVGAISGLTNGEALIGIDFRPATNVLYGVSNQNRMYTINTMTGSATLVPNTGTAFALEGSSFGFDFNPSPDRIRVTSNLNDNLRLNPANGGLAGTDTDLAGFNGAAFGNVAGAAYTNNFPGVPSNTTTLYGIDSILRQLVIIGGINAGAPQGSPNTGLVTPIGFLGLSFDITDEVGFDIAQNGIAYASLNGRTGPTGFYRINLQTGEATGIGTVAGERLIGLSVQTVPEPSSLALAASALAAAGLLARRRARR